MTGTSSASSAATTGATASGGASSRIRSSTSGGTPSVAVDIRDHATGATALTRIPCGAPSAASVRVSPTIPALSREYAAFPAIPYRPAAEVTRTTRPRPHPVKRGQAARTSRQAPKAWMAVIRSSRPSSISVKSSPGR
ncbi:hypothetical protein OG593_01500 [Streptomyces atratus]